MLPIDDEPDEEGWVRGVITPWVILGGGGGSISAYG
jgi:hypothetical protein